MHLPRFLPAAAAVLLLTASSRAGDLEDVERCAGRLAPDALRHVLATLPDERRRALERHLERFGNKPRGSVTGQRAERFWAALRLRRLFRR